MKQFPLPKKLKNVIEGLLITIFIALVSTATSYASSLPDIQNHQNEAAIRYLFETDIISGYPDGSFRPQNSINRAELTKILVGATGTIPDIDIYNNCFPDVQDQWFASYICYAKEKGWIGGYPDGYFRPNNPVNKSEALKIMLETMGVSKSKMASTFIDVPSSAWFKAYVATATELKLLEDDEKNSEYIFPDKKVSRGYVSEKIYRLLTQQEVKNTITVEEPFFSYGYIDIETDKSILKPYMRIDVENGDLSVNYTAKEGYSIQKNEDGTYSIVCGEYEYEYLQVGYLGCDITFSLNGGYLEGNMESQYDIFDDHYVESGLSGEYRPYKTLSLNETAEFGQGTFAGYLKLTPVRVSHVINEALDPHKYYYAVEYSTSERLGAEAKIQAFDKSGNMLKLVDLDSSQYESLKTQLSEEKVSAKNSGFLYQSTEEITNLVLRIRPSIPGYITKNKTGPAQDLYYYIIEVEE